MSTLLNVPVTALGNNTDISTTWTPPAGTTVVKLTFDVPTSPLSNYEDPTHTITVTVTRTSDGFQLPAQTWVGGHEVKHIGNIVDPPPEMDFNLSAYVGVQLKARLQVPVAMTAGLTVTG